MQISHENDKVSQVIFGNQSNRVARMADSAAFFHILSASLYSNPLLAALREILCNADDAHKQAGISDPINVKVTCDDDGDADAWSVVVRDFGAGIPDSMMDEIYLVFGESTKKDVEEATGGFGLGSKAPWAIVDQFFVTSHHEGVKTVYTLVKSDPDNDNKPSIQSLFSGPTDESGLEVRIPISSNKSRDVINTIGSLLYYGDMPANVRFGGGTTRLADQKGMSTIPGTISLCALPSRWGNRNYRVEPHAATLAVARESQIYIRYGTVLYPVTCQMDLPKIESHFWIIQAPPNSISLNPNRETLLYSETTLNTLRALCASVRKSLDTVKEYKMTPDEVLTGVINKLEIENPILAETVWNSCASLRHITTRTIQSEFVKFLTKEEETNITPLLTHKAIDIATDNVMDTDKTYKRLWRNNLVKLFQKGGANKSQANTEAGIVQHITSVSWHHRRNKALRTAAPKRAKKNLIQLRQIIGKNTLYVREHGFLNELQTKIILENDQSLLGLLMKKITIIRVFADEDNKARYLGGLVIKTTSSKYRAEWIKQLKAAGWEVDDKSSAPTVSTATTTPKIPSISKASEGYLCASAAIDLNAARSDSFSWWATSRAFSRLKAGQSVRVVAPVAYVKGSIASARNSATDLSTRLISSSSVATFCEKLALITTTAQAAKLSKEGIPELSEYVSSFFETLPLNGKLCVVGSLVNEVWENQEENPISNESVKILGGMFKILVERFPFPESDQTFEIFDSLYFTAKDVKSYIKYHPRSSYCNWMSEALIDEVIASLPVNWPKTRDFVNYRALLNAVYSGSVTPTQALSTYFD